MPKNNRLSGDPGRRRGSVDLHDGISCLGRGPLYLTAALNPWNADVWNAAGLVVAGPGREANGTGSGYTLGDLKKEGSAERLFHEENLWNVPSRPGGVKKVGPGPHDRKDPRFAAALSLFFAGLGQIYNGENFKGFLLFFWTLAGLIFIVPGVIIWIYGIYDAHAIAMKMDSGKIPYRKTNSSIVILYFTMLTIVVVVVATAVVASGLMGTI